MKESRESKVVIEDANANTVRDLKEFLYNDKVENICLEVNYTQFTIDDFIKFFLLSGLSNFFTLPNVTIFKASVVIASRLSYLLILLLLKLRMLPWWQNSIILRISRRRQ
jgi:hypothetical protein